MKRCVLLLCLYPFFSFGMDRLYQHEMEAETSLEVFDSFGKHRLDYELMRYERLVVINGELYQLNPDTFFALQKRIRAGEVKSWRATIDGIILNGPEICSLFKRSDLLKGVVKWASEYHLKILLGSHQFLDRELFKGIELSCLYAKMMMNTLNALKCPIRYEESLKLCKRSVLKFHKNCLMILKKFIAMNLLLKKRLPSDLALKVIRLALQEKKESDLKASL